MREAQRPPQARLSVSQQARWGALLEQVWQEDAQLAESPQRLREGLSALGEAGILGAKVGTQQGGLGLPPRERLRLQEALACASGSLAFLQAQHQTACGFLAASKSRSLRDSCLPLLLRGQLGCGVGYAHLRSPQPVLRAERVQGGYRVSGRAPWVTGWGLLERALIAARLPEGSSLLFMMSLEEQDGLLADPLPLGAAVSAPTVSLGFDQLWVEPERVVDHWPPGCMGPSAVSRPVASSGLSLGTGWAALICLRESLQAQGADETALLQLEAELVELRQAVEAQLELQGSPAWELRAAVIDFSLRAARAAAISAGGRGVLQSHRSQRLDRQALLFALVGQSQPLRASTLSRIGERGRFILEA